MDYYIPVAEVVDPVSRMPPRSAWVAPDASAQSFGLTRFIEAELLQAFAGGLDGGRTKSISATGPTPEPTILKVAPEGDLTPFAVTVVPAEKSIHAQMPLRDAIESTASRRIKLLAVQYASTRPSQEVLARMEILDARMNSYSPRVTAESNRRLDQAEAAMDGIGDDLARIDQLLAG